MMNTWDYNEGDLIEVELKGWPSEIGIVTSVGEPIPGRRKFWSWLGVGGSQRVFYKPGKVLEAEIKIKVLARA
jgi:hypothetical protein